MVWNVLAIAIAAVALLMSSILAGQQAGLMLRANHIPVYIELFSQFRSAEFQDHYSFIINRLAQENVAKEVGISGLPDEARAAVNDVSGLFTEIAALRLLGAVRPSCRLDGAGPAVEGLESSGTVRPPGTGAAGRVEHVHAVFGRVRNRRQQPPRRIDQYSHRAAPPPEGAVVLQKAPCICRKPPRDPSAGHRTTGSSIRKRKCSRRLRVADKLSDNPRKR